MIFYAVEKYLNIVFLLAWGLQSLSGFLRQEDFLRVWVTAVKVEWSFWIELNGVSELNWMSLYYKIIVFLSIARIQFKTEYFSGQDRINKISNPLQLKIQIFLPLRVLTVLLSF